MEPVEELQLYLFAGTLIFCVLHRETGLALLSAEALEICKQLPGVRLAVV